MAHPDVSQSPPSPTSSTVPRILIGTRGSALALWQANAVRRWMLDRSPARDVELSIITSDGDRDKHSPLTKIGGRGVFASALQHALLAGEIDAAVHSTKDLPGITPLGLEIAAFPEREIALDALISRHGVGLRDLPASPVIGTSSRRRAVQILALRPDARIVDLRGNIDTRLRKGRTDAYDAIILAAAGLSRMGWEHEVTEMLSIDTFTPAPGQGALAIETRVGPDPGWSAARDLDDPDVRLAVTIERAFLRGVGGGCMTPIGAHATLLGRGADQRVELHAMLATDEGDRIERAHETFAAERAMDEVFALAQRMLHAVQPAWSGVDFGAQEPGSLSPLAGARVLITGSPEVATSQTDVLRAAGAEPFLIPTVRIEPAPDPAALDVAIGEAVAGAYDWLMVTSANAVPALAARLPDKAAIRARVAAVGERTARALIDAGIAVALVPPDMSAVGLLAALADEPLDGKRVLLPLSDIARPVLADGLRARGAVVEVVTAYRTIAIDRVDAGTIATFKERDTNAVWLSSPSSVASLVDLLGAEIATISGAFFIAIGETTANAMRAAHLPVHAIAGEPTPEGMLNALLGCYGVASAASMTPTGEGTPS